MRITRLWANVTIAIMRPPKTGAGISVFIGDSRVDFPANSTEDITKLVSVLARELGFSYEVEEQESEIILKVK